MVTWFYGDTTGKSGCSVYPFDEGRSPFVAFAWLLVAKAMTKCLDYIVLCAIFCLLGGVKKMTRCRTAAALLNLL